MTNTAGVSDAGTAQSSGEQNEPFPIRPSRSAAELSDGTTVTVQTALLPVAETITRQPDAIDAPAAANPDIEGEQASEVPEPATDNSDNTQSEETQGTADNESTDGSEDSNPDTDNSNTDNSNSDNSNTNNSNTNNSNTNNSNTNNSNTDNSNTDNSNTDNSNSDNSNSDTSNSNANTSNPDSTDVNQSSGSDIPQTRFTSVTTPGFEGEVLEDSIRISWPVSSTARGYNVYRQAEYYSTVFTNEFIDNEVFDDDYYYEIQAFDFDENYSYVATGLTVRSRSFGRLDPAAPTPNANLLDNYELVFAEEFQGTELDTSIWNTSFLWGPNLIINSEEQYYVDIANDPDFGFNPFTFDGEFMTINTIKTPAELASKANNQPYLSGLITSYDSFKFTYGYFETRAKFTHGRGYWPAFWLLNAYYGGADPEIDIMEFIGDNQDVMYHTYHYFDTNGELRSTKSFPVVGIDFTEDFHTFGVEWKPGTLIFYVDNIETMRVTDANVSQQEMYILANQAVGGWWAGSPDENTPFPGKYVIDYIRVYQSTVQYDEIQFDQPYDVIPLFADDPGSTTPNHKPPFWLWPEGYPGRQ